MHSESKKDLLKNQIEQLPPKTIQIKEYFSVWLISLVVIFLSSFIFDLWALTRYNLSYGIDGAFYNIQVNSILSNGITTSGDPPLVYYLMAFFSIFFGVTLGIKVTMALFASLIVIPTFLITKLYTDTFNKKVYLPALVSSFLMVFNIYYLRLIEDFMQNLIGIFFLLWFIYCLVKWASTKEYLKPDRQFYLMILFFILNFLTHIFSFVMAAFLLGTTIIFKMYLNYRLNKKLPKKELKLISIMVVLLVILSSILLVLFPGLLEIFIKLHSFLDSFLTFNQGQFLSIMFLTIPFICGIIFILKKLDYQNPTRMIVSFNLLALSSTLFFLSLPIITQTWQTRFMLLNFIAISIVSSIGIFVLYFINYDKIIKRNRKVTMKKVTTYMICTIFILTSFISVVTYVPSMGPTITDQSYHELVTIKETYYNNTIKAGDVIFLTGKNINYWVELEFSQNKILALNQNQNLNFFERNYFIIREINNTSQFSPNENTNWNPIFPLGFLFHISSQNILPIPLQNRDSNNGPQQAQSANLNVPVGSKVLFKGNYFELFQIHNK